MEFGSPNLAVNSLATTAIGLFVGGNLYQSSDMDPGAVIDLVPGGYARGQPVRLPYAS